MVAGFLDVVKNLTLEDLHADLVEVGSTGHEVLSVVVFARQGPSDKVASVVDLSGGYDIGGVVILYPTGRIIGKRAA